MDEVTLESRAGFGLGMPGPILTDGESRTVPTVR